MIDRFGRRLSVILVAVGVVAWPAGASASMVTEFNGGLTPGFTASSVPAGLTTGPDGNLWFTENGNPGRVATIDQGGIVHELAGGLALGFSPNSRPLGVTAGPDGNVWFTENADPGRIAYVDHRGVVHEFTGGLTPGFSANSSPWAITTGPDGHVWFTEAAGPGRIAYIDGNGVVHEFTGGLTPGFSADSGPKGITAGPDGHVWFTEAAGPSRIAYIDGNGVVHEFAGGVTPGFSANGEPEAITTGPDGHVWFTETSSPGRVAYIDGNGVVHEFTGGVTRGFSVTGELPAITTSADGNLWFTERRTSSLGRVNFASGVPDGTVTEFAAGATSGLTGDPFAITTGPDGHVWFTEQGAGGLGRVNGPDAATDAAGVSGPRSATLNGEVTPNGETVTDCHFDFGTSAAYGTSIPCAQRVAGGTSPVAVSAGVGPLVPGGTYHYRVLATNVFGTGASGDQTFRMPALAPSVATGGAARVGSHIVALTGSVNPNGGMVIDCHFDYGTSTAYGSSVPCAQQVGGGDGLVSVSANLAGLNQNTTYHFRLVATNLVGTSAGADQNYAVATQAPALSRLRLTTARFPATPRGHRRTGTTISYRDSIAARTTFTIERCLSAPPRGHRRCTIVGTFSHADHSGLNRLHFTGRVAGKPLAPEKYTLIAVAASTGMSSRPVTARFEVTR